MHIFFLFDQAIGTGQSTPWKIISYLPDRLPNKRVKAMKQLKLNSIRFIYERYNQRRTKNDLSMINFSEIKD